LYFIDNHPRSVGSVHPPFPISGEPSLRAAALNNDFVFVYSLCFIALPVRASFLPADWFSDGLRAAALNRFIQNLQITRLPIAWKRRKIAAFKTFPLNLLQGVTQ